MSGYICIRSNEWLNEYNIYLIKFVKNVKIFNTNMINNEPFRGKFEKVFEIPLDKIKIVYELFIYHFQKFNYNKEYNKIELYKKDILPFIILFFNNIKIQYKELSNDEIEKLIT